MEQATVSSYRTRLKPSSRLVPTTPAFEPWMISRDGLALPITSCDADLYATVYAASSDGCGTFSETMTAFAITHGFSNHTVIAARRRLQEAGLIEHVLDDTGERVKVSRPGKPVYLYRANLAAALDAEKRFRAALPATLAEISAIRGDAEAAAPVPILAETVVETPAGDDLLRPEPAPEARVAPSSEEPTYHEITSAHLSAPAPVAPPAPGETASAIADKQADELLWILKVCYPKAQRGMDEATSSEVKLALADVVGKLGATKDELRAACEIRRAEARANNPELFDGGHSEAQKWRYLPSVLDFVTKPEGLAASITTVRMNGREEASSRQTYPASDHNVTVGGRASNGKRASLRTKDNTDPRDLAEAILSESKYRKVSGQDLWFAQCMHGINGQYMTWELPGAVDRADAAAKHREILEIQLDLRGCSCGESIESVFSAARGEQASIEPQPVDRANEESAAAPAKAFEPTDGEEIDCAASKSVGGGTVSRASGDCWADVVAGLISSRPPLGSLVRDTTAIEDDGTTLWVGVPASNQFAIRRLAQEKNSAAVTSAVAEAIGPREVAFIPIEPPAPTVRETACGPEPYL